MADRPAGQTEELVINMGPQHPSTHGVLRVVLTVDGELVVDADPDVGYLHSSLEKIGEALTWRQYVPYTDRYDYLSAINNEFAFVRAVEKLLGIQVTERCEYIRVIMAEVQRIASHLMYFTAMGLDVGATTVYLHCFRDRELLIDLLENTTGQRLLYHYFRIGGLRNDLACDFVDGLRSFIQYFPARLQEYDNLLTRNRIFRARMEKVASISAAEAIRMGMSGPCLRACGVSHDLRKVLGYSVYPEFDFDVPVFQGGDAMARHLVRCEEMRQSLRILEQAIAKLPAGEVNVSVPRAIKPEPGHVYERIEGPRGEVGCYLVSDGSEKPVRVRWRPPSYFNLQPLPVLMRGGYIADTVVAIASLDIMLGDIDK
ncbi:MAG: NADH-quinone oxidoreductase subunit D [Armatimonadetes bacterium]|nr:NADH-quinone oxidoreductase subunit D [Armatimonadota bacterium]